MKKEVLVTFIDDATKEEIHNCNCCSEEIETIYAAGKDIEIKGIKKRIISLVPCINGHITYKVFVR